MPEKVTERFYASDKKGQVYEIFKLQGFRVIESLGEVFETRNLMVRYETANGATVNHLCEDRRYLILDDGLRGEIPVIRESRNSPPKKD